MDRPERAAAQPARQGLQLRHACIVACIVALGPMLLYYYHEFRIVDWPLEVSGYPVGRDFVNLWSGGRAAWSGDFATLFDAKKYAIDLQRHVHPSIVENGLVWSYPPTAFWIGLPFAGLPFYLALALWLLLGFAGVLWAFRLGKMQPLPWWPLPWLVLAPGVLMVLFFAQTALVTSSLFIGGLVLARRRPWLAGALLAGFVVKPHMGLAIPVVLLALRHWRAFLATAVFTVVYVVVTVLAFGLEPWELYLGITLPKHLAMLTPWGFRLPWMFTAQYFPLLASGLSAGVALHMHWLIAAAALGMMAWALPRLRDGDLQLAAAAAATLLISPYMQAYELALPALIALRIAAYAPAPGSDQYLTARYSVAIISLLAPVIGLLTVLLLKINPVSALMLANIALLVATTQPSRAELNRWRHAVSRWPLRLRRALNPSQA